MVTRDYHAWVDEAANKLILRGDILWQAMCAEWAINLAPEEASKIVQPIDDAIIGLEYVASPKPRSPDEPAATVQTPDTPSAAPKQPKAKERAILPLFDTVDDIPRDKP